MSESSGHARAYWIFARALELTESRRQDFLTAECAAEPALRPRVESLLALAVSGSAATQGLLAGFGADEVAVSVDHVGQQFGCFLLVERLGAGGMGTVYRAQRTDGLPQTVAVKLLHQPVPAAEGSQFLREARILARLDHPSIARLIDAGIRDGTGWIAMEFVRGSPITEYCDAHQLTLAGRLRLLIAVADAIATAHRLLVVHRDIKPSNVIIDPDGAPKLIDFGIASVLADGQVSREATADVRALFTAHYGAPEQLRGEPVTVATDVFGLGALAYRLLSGVELFAEARTPLGYLLAVTQEEARPASAVAADHDASGTLPRALRGDLDAILAKALDRNPEGRYLTIEALRADLEAFLAAQPVSARRTSWPYRAGKFAVRNALPLAIVLFLGAAAATAAVVYLRQERRVVQAQAAAARRGAFLEGLIRSADPTGGQRDITVAALLDRASNTLEAQLKSEPAAQASMFGLIAQTNLGLGRPREGLLASDRELQLLRQLEASPQARGQALSVRGQLYREQSQWQPSLDALQQALGLLQPAADPGTYYDTLSSLGAAQAALQQLPAAEATYRRELSLLAGSDPRWFRSKLDVENSLMGLLTELGRYTEAESLARTDWLQAQSTLTRDDPLSFTVEDDYAVALRNVQRPREAEPLFLDAIARAERVLGPTHHDTLVTKLGYGNELIALHRYPEAMKLTGDVARTLATTLGPDNWYALLGWNAYGVAACEGNRPQEGLEVLQRVATTRRGQLPPGHRILLSLDVDIGKCLMHLRRYAEAEPVLTAAARALEQSRGGDFIKTQEATAALVELHRLQGKPSGPQAAH